MKKLLKYLKESLQNELSNPILKDFLDKRKLTAQDIIDFKLGFSTFNDNPKFLQENEEYYKSCTVLNENGFTTIRNRLCFPLFDLNDEVCAIACRNLEENPYPKVLTPTDPSMYKSFFNLKNAKNEILKYNEVIIVEGQLDCISLYRHGIKNVIAVGGSCISEQQLKDITKLTKNLIFAFDNDDAGYKACITNFMKYIDRDLSIKACPFWSDCKDPDEFILKYGVEQTALKLSKAMDVFDFWTAFNTNHNEIADQLVDNCGSFDLLMPTMKCLSKLDIVFFTYKKRLLKKRIKTFADAKKYLYIDSPLEIDIIDYALALLTTECKSLDDRIPDISFLENNKNADISKFEQIKKRIK